MKYILIACLFISGCGWVSKAPIIIESPITQTDNIDNSTQSAEEIIKKVDTSKDKIDTVIEIVTVYDNSSVELKKAVSTLKEVKNELDVAKLEATKIKLINDELKIKYLDIHNKLMKSLVREQEVSAENYNLTVRIANSRAWIIGLACTVLLFMVGLAVFIYLKVKGF